jgi:hypothetical protein
MPLVRVSLVKGKPELYRRKVGDAVHRALVEAVGVPAQDRFQLLTEHESTSPATWSTTRTTSASRARATW